ncbi:hypothetical protein NDU88_005169 [Pleurodeles waltl]|uniref:AIG1-type G domain-containing protein n=1 Tax=Pleurodeles waltl TaxID=8319 RepID=A0AAV7V378_PLEWA|nr:hypothetical protein NDU88_005169 [Pleurodeles waltl]
MACHLRPPVAPAVLRPPVAPAVLRPPAPSCGTSSTAPSCALLWHQQYCALRWHQQYCGTSSALLWHQQYCALRWHQQYCALRWHQQYCGTSSALLWHQQYCALRWHQQYCGTSSALLWHQQYCALLRPPVAPAVLRPPVAPAVLRPPVAPAVLRPPVAPAAPSCGTSSTVAPAAPSCGTSSTAPSCALLWHQQYCGTSSALLWHQQYCALLRPPVAPAVLRPPVAPAVLRPPVAPAVLWHQQRPPVAPAVLRPPVAPAVLSHRRRTGQGGGCNSLFQIPHIQSTMGTRSLNRGELRIILTGSAGAGKSATGNSILDGKHFLSKASQNSVTLTCDARTGFWKGTKLVVVDTPGFFSRSTPAEEVKPEVRQCLNLCHPGPHAIVLVLQTGRFSQEERQSVERIQSLFGRKARKHMVIVFTRKEDLEDKSIDQFVKEAEPGLKQLIAKCGGRYCAFSNKGTRDVNTQQVQELMNIIKRMVEENGGHFIPDEGFTLKDLVNKGAAIGAVVGGGAWHSSGSSHRLAIYTHSNVHGHSISSCRGSSTIL